MKKIEENKILYALVLSVFTILAGMIIQPLLDLIVANIQGNKFKYDIDDHIIQPITFGITFGIFYTLVYFKLKKNK